MSLKIGLTVLIFLNAANGNIYQNLAFLKIMIVQCWKLRKLTLTNEPIFMSDTKEKGITSFRGPVPMCEHPLPHSLVKYVLNSYLCTIYDAYHQDIGDWV